MWILHLKNLLLNTKQAKRLICHKTWALSRCLAVSQRSQGHLSEWRMKRRKKGGFCFLFLRRSPREWMIKHFLPCPMIQSNEAFKSLVYLSCAVRDGSRRDGGTEQPGSPWTNKEACEAAYQRTERAPDLSGQTVNTVTSAKDRHRLHMNSFGPPSLHKCHGAAPGAVRWKPTRRPRGSHGRARGLGADAVW